MYRYAYMCYAILFLLSAQLCAQGTPDKKPMKIQTEAEELVFAYEYAATGAGPMWAHGSSVMVHVGDKLFVSGQVPVPEMTGINCIRPTLHERTDEGWKTVYTDPGNTREPSPLTALSKDTLLMSNNRNNAKPDEYDGEGHPEIQVFDINNPNKPIKTLIPIWSTDLKFHGHTYRCFCSDVENKEFFLSWNLAYDRTYWTFYDRSGRWVKQGELVFPVGAEYPNQDPIRLCYSPVLLKDRAVYFFGTGDVTEPVEEWRAFKYEQSKSQWDYVFRRLFYCYTPDITKKPFSEWIEITNLDKTAGNAWAHDVYLAKNGDVYLLWSETSTDYKIKQKFMPEVKMYNTLKCGLVRDGKLVKVLDLVKGGEGVESDETPTWGRFFVTPEARLFAVYTATVKAPDGKTFTKNRLREIFSNQSVGEPIELSLDHPFTSTFILASPRSGSPVTNYIELFGNCADTGNELRYARIRIDE